MFWNLLNLNIKFLLFGLYECVVVCLRKLVYYEHKAIKIVGKGLSFNLNQMLCYLTAYIALNIKKFNIQFSWKFSTEHGINIFHNLLTELCRIIDISKEIRLGIARGDFNAFYAIYLMCLCLKTLITVEKLINILKYTQ